MTDRPAFVLLEDGTWYPGTTPVPLEPAFGEVVFTTNLTGYQETFTDPSYLGQIVVMTAPMIGNYGVNPDDDESGRPQVAGIVVRELSRQTSNWRAAEPLETWLARHAVPLIEGVDTRRLTRHLRERGAMPTSAACVARAMQISISSPWGCAASIPACISSSHSQAATCRPSVTTC